MVYKRMHITGGVGAFADEEKFGPDYVLPNNAYLETCAAVGASFFHRNMNMAFGEARYIDQLERALYNGALCGVSLKGDTYFYQNPLEANKDRTRWVWHDCPCCPPMFLKLMGAMPGYIYATDEDSFYINLFVSSEASTSLNDRQITVKQKSRYPWNGRITITVEPRETMSFNLMIRIPEWCIGESLRVNGVSMVDSSKVRGYRRIQRTWQPGDVVELDLPMRVERIKAHPMVEADAGKVAIARGPLVYCFESADNGDSVRLMGLSAGAAFDSYHDPNLLDGVTVVTTTARCLHTPGWTKSLYASAHAAGDGRAVKLKAVPYYANANRGPVEMTVWLPETA
jgi:DUF1680 family protein